MTHIRTISATETLSQESNSILSMLHAKILSNCRVDTEQSSDLESEPHVRASMQHYQDLVDIKITPLHTPLKGSLIEDQAKNKKSRNRKDEIFSCKSCGKCQIV